MITNVISNYLYGAKFVPFVGIAFQASNQIGKVLGIVNQTLFNKQWQDFQRFKPYELDPLIPAQGIKRLAARQFLFFTANQFMPLLEEFIFSTVIQYGLFTYLGSKTVNCMQTKSSSKPVKPKWKKKPRPRPTTNSMAQKILRVAIPALFFGYIHYSESELLYKTGQIAAEEINDISWMQITGNIGTRLVYGTVYELSGQSLFAAWGTHAVWNYCQDLITYDFWY